MADETQSETNGATGANGFSPPYTSFKTLMNMIERMAAEGGVPSRVDRSYLSNLPGSSQTMLLSSLKSIGLIDEQARPTRALIEMVDDPDNRPTLVADTLRERYGLVLELSANATQAQLEEAFRDYGVSGSTMRKAVAFFLAAAKYADIRLSPHFRTPKATSGMGRRPRPGGPKPSGSTRRGGGGGEIDQSPTPVEGDAKSRYVELLLKKADETGDEKLLDRIEKVLGLDASTASAPARGQGDDASRGGDSN